MSGQTVTGNGLQFTDDNKHAYAYSGEIGVGSSTITLSLLQTNSEYLNATLQIMNGTTSNEDFKYVVYFNDVVVAQWHFLYAATINQSMPNVLNLIVPPFTTIKITANNLDSATLRNHTVVFNAKVGMAPRVGN